MCGATGPRVLGPTGHIRHMAATPGLHEGVQYMHHRLVHVNVCMYMCVCWRRKRRRGEEGGREGQQQNSRLKYHRLGKLAE